VIAIALAGCTSAKTTTATPASGSAQATKAAETAGSGSTVSGSSSPVSASAVSGTDLFGGLNYNWVEYKMTTDANGNAGMTIYLKYDKAGKCSMRFEGPGASNLPANMQNMDCGASSKSSGTSSPSNPNKIGSSAQVTCSGDESVTVPAGTFTATKCSVSAGSGGSETVWIAKDKFLVKVEGKSGQATFNMDLNAYG